MKLRNKLVGVTLLGAAVGSSALSLGRARGAVVLGQPLSLAVEVRVDNPDDAIAQCFRAEVTHGDLAVDASRVRVIVQAPGAGSQDAVVRIRSTAIVDEPVVGVVLHALCGQQGVRRYDFLPEYPAELVAAQVPVARAAESSAFPTPDAGRVVAAPVAPAPRAPAAAAPRPAPARAPQATARAAQAKAIPPARRPAPRPVAAAPRVEKAAKAEPAAQSVTPPSTGRPRLTLDAPLRSITALAGPPAENPAERADAAAAWRALNAQPSDMLDTQRLQALEEQAKGVQAARDKAERDLRARLERAEQRLDEAESKRVDIALVYGLLALLLLTIAAAAYFWHRARKAALEAAHWAQGPIVAGGVPSVSPTFASASASKPLGDDAVERTPAPAGAGLDKWAAAAGLGAPVPSVTARATPVAVPVRVEPPMAAQRTMNPEEFFDVQQHADFFVSLGQYDQAIEVLKKHIEEHAEMSPLAFLELFKIYHTLGRQSEYNALRDSFQRMFNARIPNFAAFADEGLGLDDYPATLLSIETAWGDARVLDTLEANIFRHPEDTGRPLDLAAFRDLLLLHAVAKNVLHAGGDSLLPDGGGSNTWKGGLDDGAALRPRRLAQPDFSASLAPAGLDLDLASVPATLASVASVSPRPEMDSGPIPLSSPQYDHGLVLDLDLSGTHNAPLEQPQAPAAPPLPDIGLDIDLELLDMDSGAMALPQSDAATPAATPAAGNKPAVDSGLIDFDLFDPNTEARIAPKSTR